jgi:chromate reductase
MASEPIHILGIAGSLRRESYNRGALRAATKLVPEGAILETFELHGIPVFNQDEDQNPPPKVSDFKRRIREADAILFVTPEYNYSVPGVLKNAIDWASRPTATARGTGNRRRSWAHLPGPSVRRGRSTTCGRFSFTSICFPSTSQR